MAIMDGAIIKIIKWLWGPGCPVPDAVI